MNTDMKGSSSEEALENIIISNVRGFTGTGGGGGTGSSTANGTSTLEMPDLQRKQKELTESLQREMGLQRDQMRKVDEKCNTILVKIPLLEHRAEDVAAIRRELELEREQRTENEKQFTECIDLLKKEILQLNLKVSNLEKRIEDMDKQNEASNVPSTSSTSQEECVSEVVGRLLNDLSLDINSRFQELEDNQEMLQAQIQNTRKDLNLSFFVTPTVEATLMRPSPSVIPASNMDTLVPPVNQFGVQYETEETSHSLPGVSPMTTEEPGHSKTVMPITFIVPRDPVPPVNFGAADDAPESPDDIGLLHGQAALPGRHLPLLCLCGLEYASPDSLAQHVMEELIGRTPSYDSTTLRPSQHASTSMSLSQALVTSASTPLSALLGKNPVAHGIGSQLVDAAGKVKFYCKCGKHYCSRQYLQYHIRAVSSRALFHCPICWKEYSRIAPLRVHMKVKHQVGYLMGKCVCSVCGKLFNDMADLLAHRSASHSLIRNNSKSVK